MGDSQIRVYNYNTSEKITSFEAHPDYIRAIVVHPTQPFVLTASDDMTIKLWDWEKGWKNVRVFEGNSRMWKAGSAVTRRRNADRRTRLRDVSGDQPQGHKYLCFGLLGQDRCVAPQSLLFAPLTRR
jgi:WD40 repeat protein